MPDAQALPKITVVTPSYNQGQYLEQTIRSVLDQNYPNVEFIICDGGSKDQSVEVIKKYADRLAFWCSEKDRGQSHAINKGFGRATGDLYCYINSDDYFEPGTFDRVARAYQQGHEFIVGWSLYLEPDGDFRPYPVKRTSEPADWLVTNPIPQQSAFWSARLWKQLGAFREDLHYSFDYEYWLRVKFRAGVGPHLVNKCMAVFRLHAASKTVSEFERFGPEDDALFDEYAGFLTGTERRGAIAVRKREKARTSRKAAWAALKSKDVPKARKLAMSTFRNAKANLDSWRLMYCALRGH